MYKMKESEDRLNQYAMTLQGNQLSFHVYYWGSNPCHYDNPIHKHSFFEICYVMNGNGAYWEENVVHPLGPGTFFCSRPGITHQIRSETGLSLLFVAFEINENKSSMEEAHRFHMLSENASVCIHSAASSAVALLWKALLVPVRQEWELRHEQLPLLAHTLLSSFSDLFMKQEHKLKQFVHSHADSLLQQAKLYIHDNLDQPLTLETVSAYLHISKRHLSRLFSYGINETFGRFVHQERMREAVYLLKNSQLSIKEISQLCGFNSIHSFTRAFTSAKRCSPAAFRRTRE